jgi:hypothetical protein
MSGKPWPPERKAAHAAAMRIRWATGVYAKRRPPSIDDAERAARSARASLLNIRMRDNEELKGRCIHGMKRVRRSKTYRAIQAAVMAETVKRPELRRRARFHCITINKNRRVRKRQWAGRRRKKVKAQKQTRRKN